VLPRSPGRLRARSGAAGAKDLDGGRDPCSQGRSGLIAPELPGVTTTARRAYHRSRRQRHHRTASYRRTASAKPGRNSTTTRMVQALKRHAPSKFLKSEIPCAAGRRQLRPHRTRYLSDAVMGNRCVDPAEEPRRVQSLVAKAWLDATAISIRQSRCTRLDYKRNLWPRDAGLRLDHLLPHPGYLAPLIKAGFDRKVRADKAPATMRRRGSCCASVPATIGMGAACPSW